MIITGCSSGFGRAAARLFADCGWNVVATMRKPEAGAELAKHPELAAVTGGTDQFRYLPTDDIKPLVAARRESSESGYMTLMRGLFMPQNL
ncbi:short-chain alcohol dehydrogenase [Opitutaceae bacterium TAV1]|nr:short-chain alcohol dehydrogenase [Opitutaceae bacterium TAV1]